MPVRRLIELDLSIGLDFTAMSVGFTIIESWSECEAANKVLRLQPTPVGAPLSADVPVYGCSYFNRSVVFNPNPNARKFGLNASHGYAVCAASESALTSVIPPLDPPMMRRSYELSSDRSYEVATVVHLCATCHV